MTLRRRTDKKGVATGKVSRRDFLLGATGAALAMPAVAPAFAGPSIAKSPTPSGSVQAADAWLPVTGQDREVLDVAGALPSLDLGGTWSVTALPLEAQGKEGYQQWQQMADKALAAQVPGDVHLDLVRAGRMPDPLISDNARTQCRWPEEHSWWYQTEFTPPPTFRTQ